MAKGVEITFDNLTISDRASLLLPWHRDMDQLEETRLADKKYGFTKQGIAPFYSDTYQKKTILAGEIFYPEELKVHLADLMEWKNGLREPWKTQQIAVFHCPKDSYAVMPSSVLHRTSPMDFM